MILFGGAMVAAWFKRSTDNNNNNETLDAHTQRERESHTVIGESDWLRLAR